MPLLRLLVAIEVILCSVVPANAQLKIPQNPLWKPIVDEIYLQEIPALFPTEHPVHAVAVHQNTVRIGDANGVQRVEEGGRSFANQDCPLRLPGCSRRTTSCMPRGRQDCGH